MVVPSVVLRVQEPSHGGIQEAFPKARCGLKCAGQVGRLPEGTKMRRKVKKSMSMTHFSHSPLCATVRKP